MCCVLCNLYTIPPLLYPSNTEEWDTKVFHPRIYSALTNVSPSKLQQFSCIQCVPFALKQDFKTTKTELSGCSILWFNTPNIYYVLIHSCDQRTIPRRSTYKYIRQWSISTHSIQHWFLIHAKIL